MEYMWGKINPSTFQESLYVGAMDHLFRLDASNLSRHSGGDLCSSGGADPSRVLPLPASNAEKCMGRGKSEDFHCRNHVRVIQVRREGCTCTVPRIFFCLKFGSAAVIQKSHFVAMLLWRLQKICSIN